MSGNPYFLINRGTQARGDKEDQGNEISKKIASLISEVHCHTSESAVMNHSSILQIHLNGGENSLSGGEHSIRIFSPASASSSATSFLLLSKGLIERGVRGWVVRGETAAPATGALPEKAAAICGRRGNLSWIWSPRPKVSRDLLSFQKKSPVGGVDSSFGRSYEPFLTESELLQV